jgi:hypothetical protein
MQKQKNANPMHDYAQFKTEQQRWAAKKFMDLTPYIMNRDIEPRVAKMVKRLQAGPMPTHLRVAVGKVTKPFGPYMKGDYFRFDGNTRTEAWKVRNELIPNIPLVVDIYEVNDKSEADRIYYDIDSVDSVETSNDKVTGLLRERNYNAKSQVVKLGRFKTAIKNACRYAYSKDGEYLMSKDLRDNFSLQMDTYWKELVEIDKLNLNTFTRYSGNVLTALLLIVKKHGLRNETFKELFNNYSEGITNINTSNEMDGVHYVFNVLYGENHKIWTQTGFSNSFTLVSKILYGFDMFMNNQTISKKTKIPSDGKLRKFYQNYLND